MPDIKTGSFLQGFMNSFSQSMQASRTNKAQRDYVKSQKALLDAKLKEQEAKQAFLNANPQLKQAQMMPPGLAQDLMMLQAQMGQLNVPLPTGQAGPMQQFSPFGAPPAQIEPDPPLAPGQAGPPEPVDAPPPQARPGIAEIIAKAQTDPLIRSAVKKATGIDFGKRTFQRGLVGEEGGQVTKEIGAMGGVIAEHEEATTKKFVQIAGPKGAMWGQWVDSVTGQPVIDPDTGLPVEPIKTKHADLKTTTTQLTDGTVIEYETNPLIPGSKFNERLKTMPPLVKIEQINEEGEKTITYANPRNLETVTVEPAARGERSFVENGVTYVIRFNKVTGEDIGERWIKKIPSPAEAGRRGMAEGAVQDLNRVVSMLINEDGSINDMTVKMAVGPGVPWTDGRSARQSFGRAVDLLIRSASGAALNEQEIDNYNSLYFPSVWDSEEGQINKVNALKLFIDGFAQSMNPDGTVNPQNLSAETMALLPPRIREKIEAKLKKPSLDLGRTQVQPIDKDADAEFQRHLKGL
jgi:hypothetical protein